jgi:transcription elongation factor GreA
MSTNVPDGEPITPAGLVALEAEIKELETVGRREMAARILAARELGDLSENADYHIAKEDQAHLETKILRLNERLRNAYVAEADAGASTVQFGGKVTIADEESGGEQTWTLVGSTEADARAGKLSAESPVARALIGAAPGDVVEVQTPRGARRMRVVSLG